MKHPKFIDHLFGAPQDSLTAPIRDDFARVSLTILNFFLSNLSFNAIAKAK